MKSLYISLGTNLGERQVNLAKAAALLEADLGECLAASSVYETGSWGYAGADFLNMILAYEVDIEPAECLRIAMSVEEQMGRERKISAGYADRLIDVDILLYGDMQVNAPGLEIPHPRIAERLFVLLPLAELDSEIQLPGTDRTIGELAQACADNGKCEVYVPV